MAWDRKEVQTRIKERDIPVSQIDVKDLTKEMNFESLSSTEARRVNGSHLYLDIPNFHHLIDAAGQDQQKQKKIIRAASVLRKVQSDILKEFDSVEHIQTQNVRLHALTFKPYDDNAKLTTNALFCAMTLLTYIYEVFNEQFSEVNNFYCRAGIDHGRSFVTNIGLKGNRELISLGDCANIAAKILNGSGNITVANSFFKELPKDLQALFQKTTVNNIEVHTCNKARLTEQNEIAKSYGHTFDKDKWVKKTNLYKDELPLSDIEFSDAEVEVDISTLTEKNSKRFEAVSIFADVDGFTKYVSKALKEDDFKSAKEVIRLLNAIRTETHQVLHDEGCVVIQHRGDCAIAIKNTPAGNDSIQKRHKKAVNAAISLHSSMEVLNEHYSDYSDLNFAIGLASDQIVVTRLGKQGQRENVIFGDSVVKAEDLQQASKGADSRITEDLYSDLDDSVRSEFSKSGETYLASGLTHQVLKDNEAEKGFKASKAQVENTDVRIGTNEGPSHLNNKSWYKYQ